MRHRHALHAGLAALGAVVGICCSSAAPPPPPAPAPEPVAVASPVAPTVAPAPPPVASSARPSGPDCPTDCKGSASPALASALRARAIAGKACYQRALRDGAVKGSAMAHLTIAQSGVACRADIEVPDDLAPMRSCLKELFAGSTFPPPGGGCARVDVPLNFELVDGGVDASPKR